MKHQSGKAGWIYSDEDLCKVVIIKINIDSMTEKKSF